MGVDLLSKLWGSTSLSLPSPSLPLCGPSNTARGLGERCKLPQRGPGHSPAGRTCILGAFRAQNRVYWQQCDMPHNHSLIINIHWYWRRLCFTVFHNRASDILRGSKQWWTVASKISRGSGPSNLRRIDAYVPSLLWGSTVGILATAWLIVNLVFYFSIKMESW